MVKRATCHDCGTKEGQLHILGCDMERCPFCGNQLISCQCVYKKLRIDVSPGAWAYSHGLTDAQQKDWEKLLGDKGRIPFVLYPNLCAKCGTLWPEMFLVPDAEWKHYIEPQMQREMLCKACYKQDGCVDNGSSCGVVLKLSNRFFGALAGARFFFGFRPRLLGIGKQWVGTDQVGRGQAIRFSPMPSNPS